MGVMRCCLEEAISFARQRTTFGKKLVEHQVIQHKLGGHIALLKVQSTKTCEFVAREAVQ